MRGRGCTHQSFVARYRVVEGPDRRRRTHRRAAQDSTRTVTTNWGGRTPRPRVHRLRPRNHRAAAVRARCAGRRARGPTARIAERRARDTHAREALFALPHHRGATMVPSARTPLRTDRLRAVNEPRAVTVELNESGRMTVGRPDGQTVGQVEAILESWRIDDEWWRQQIARAYMEVMLSDGSHLILLAESPHGYTNLCRLLTEAHLGAERLDPRLLLTAIEARHEGLIILSGSRRDGLLPRTLENEGLSAARKLVEECRAVFGADRFFVEIQRNRVRGDLALSRALIGLASDVQLGVVATGRVHYHTRERHRLHDIMVAIRHRTTLDGSHRVRNPNSEFYLRPLEEVVALFHDCPDAVANTLAIAERAAAFDLTRDLGYTFPDFRGADRAPAPRVLAELCSARIQERYPPGSLHHAQAKRRLDEELRLIEHHKLSGFFLVYHDLFDLARDVAADIRRGSRRASGNLLPGRGRGSSVSSIVCYLLGLSHIDPIANRLFLGRFFNESLASVPDIDLDFPREIREELIRRVYTRYGAEHAGLVCSFPTYRLRSAVREIGKALDLPAGEIEQVAKLADSRSGSGLADELDQLPGFAGRRNAPLWKELCELAEEISGLPRHVSQHVGGMII